MSYIKFTANTTGNGVFTFASPGTNTNRILLLPDADDTLSGLAASQTLTNKTLTNPTINGFTGDTSVVNLGSGQFYKDTSGNIGIGTSSPSTKLQVAGTSGSTQFQAGTASNGYFQINAFDSNPVYCVVGGANATAGVFGTQSNTPTIFFTNNTERMRIDSSGNVGIGTSSPQGKLDVRGNTNGSHVLYVQNDSVGASAVSILQLNAGGRYTNFTANYTSQYLQNASNGLTTYYQDYDTQIFRNNAGTERMRINSSGYVGIGTSSPAYTLHTYGGSGASVIYSSAATGQVAYVCVAGNGNTFGSTSFDIIQNNTSGYIYNRANQPIIFGTNNTEAMRIDSSGNVGIGTSSPSTYSAKLAVVGGQTALVGSSSNNPLYLMQTGGSSGYTVGIENFNTTGTTTYSGISIAARGSNPYSGYFSAIRFNFSNGWWEFVDASNNASTPISAGGIGNYQNSSFQFYTNATERMRIDSSGNLLVGLTSPLAGAKASFYQNNANASWAGFFQAQNTYGCVGITNVSGTAAYTAIGLYNNGTSFSSCGSISVSGTTAAYNTTSDYRLKENVQPMTDGLATVSALKPVRYDWISTKERGEGFIAHELSEVIPNAVTGEKDAINEDGSIKPQGVDYSKIVVHLVAAIQELKAEFDAYKYTHP